MNFRSSDYLDDQTKEEIKKAVLFFRTAGWKSKDEICKKIAGDFDVTMTSVYEIMDELEKNGN